ncbi:hypothetical protein E5Q_06627 [Mixia osmundae IAM 14324]|uniref:Importin N-terminal domain-containing protein n=1 Tax=Mixia osmundae (strain CBS 9802 / IAM 14324 / JCM 22182 / KY 12970) TaxID=764103 RepID=G7EAR4_MIXOS|nr:hypothetical protein E5Q_06627 [Mixia osmundae IAM 14324]
MSSEVVFQALQTLYENPDRAAKDAANEWLQAFQREPSAWQTCNEILVNAGAPTQARLFAAQSFRAKVIHDLTDLDTAARFGLRDLLLGTLSSPQLNKEKVVVRQIALALAALLLQTPEWQNAVQSVIEQLGGSAQTLVALLIFLTVLPEEATNNSRLVISNETYRSPEVVGQIPALLASYHARPDATLAIKTQCFDCLAAWLRAGEIPAQSVVATPMFGYLFDSLNDSTVFDESIHTLCELINETQEVQDNTQVIQQILPRLLALQGQMEADKEDDMKMRGYAQLLSEAGRVYASLILHHTEAFMPLVNLILQCAAYHELEVVSKTFEFWYYLQRVLSPHVAQASVQPLVEAYRTLVGYIVRHLHFPADEDSVTAEELDEFREFRHHIGNTLKDCCSILTPSVGLKQVYDMVASAVASGSAPWQSIEAPLFSMRSMGAQVPNNEETVLPLIMDMLPNLPAHPKIKYATILVISRYTEWIAAHPQYLAFQLTYISSGFSDAETRVWLASAQAMQNLCKDCSQHLIPYLPQLHTFLTDVGPNLDPADYAELTEGVAHVVAAMPPQEAIAAMPMFCMPMLEQLHTIAAQPGTATKAQMTAVSDILARLDAFLLVCSELSPELPIACEKTCAEAWTVIESLLDKYGESTQVVERSCAVIRRSMLFFGTRFHPIAPRVIMSMATRFQKSGFSSYMWISSKAPEMLKSVNSQSFREIYMQAFNLETAKVTAILGEVELRSIPDVFEDYLALVSETLRHTPDILLSSPELPRILAIVVAAFTLPAPAVVYKATDLALDIIGHESLAPSDPSHAAYGQAIHGAIVAIGPTLTAGLLLGLTGDFEDFSTAITICRIMAQRFPAEFAGWVSTGLQSVPQKVLPVQDRAQFSERFGTAMGNQNLSGVRDAFMTLARATKKAKAREAMQVRLNANED